MPHGGVRVRVLEGVGLRGVAQVLVQEGVGGLRGAQRRQRLLLRHSRGLQLHVLLVGGAGGAPWGHASCCGCAVEVAGPEVRRAVAAWLRRGAPRVVGGPGPPVHGRGRNEPRGQGREGRERPGAARGQSAAAAAAAGGGRGGCGGHGVHGGHSGHGGHGLQAAGGRDVRAGRRGGVVRARRLVRKEVFVHLGAVDRLEGVGQAVGHEHRLADVGVGVAADGALA